jgi:hypothetical protein
MKRAYLIAGGTVGDTSSYELANGKTMEVEVLKVEAYAH